VTAAQITPGRMPRPSLGKPKAVLVATTEDSSKHAIVPTLMAAGADLDRVYRLDVETASGIESSIPLPRDLRAVEAAVMGHLVATRACVRACVASYSSPWRKRC